MGVEMNFGATTLLVPCYFDKERRDCISMTSCAETQESDDSDSSETPTLFPTPEPTRTTGKQCLDSECEDLYPSSCYALAEIALERGFLIEKVGRLVDAEMLSSSAEFSVTACRESCEEEINA